MKRGTTPTIQIQHDLDITTVEKVYFLFKQSKSENSGTILVKHYPEDTTESEGVFNIPFIEEETRLFKSNMNFYCDAKIVLVNGKIPATEILVLNCTPTLWGESDV